MRRRATRGAAAADRGARVSGTPAMPGLPGLRRPACATAARERARASEL